MALFHNNCTAQGEKSTNNKKSEQNILLRRIKTANDEEERNVYE